MNDDLMDQDFNRDLADMSIQQDTSGQDISGQEYLRR